MMCESPDWREGVPLFSVAGNDWLLVIHSATLKEGVEFLTGQYSILGPILGVFTYPLLYRLVRGAKNRENYLEKMDG